MRSALRWKFQLRLKMKNAEDRQSKTRFLLLVLSVIGGFMFLGCYRRRAKYAWKPFGSAACNIPRLSVGQSLSALCTSSLKNCSSVCRSHSLSEAMLLFSLTLFGLISSEHYSAPPWVVESEAFSSGRPIFCRNSTDYLRLYTMTSCIIHDKVGFCQVFF